MIQRSTPLGSPLEFSRQGRWYNTNCGHTDTIDQRFGEAFDAGNRNTRGDGLPSDVLERPNELRLISAGSWPTVLPVSSQALLTPPADPVRSAVEFLPHHLQDQPRRRSVRVARSLRGLGAVPLPQLRRVRICLPAPERLVRPVDCHAREFRSRERKKKYGISMPYISINPSSRSSSILRKWSVMGLRS